MGRWTQYDEDSYRLPEGMVRTGYDADTGRYFFKDREGTYVGAPGSRYGPVYPVKASRGQTQSTRPTSAPKEERPQKAKRLSDVNITDALKSLRRSLTTARSHILWRRGQATDLDEEPIMVSRPSSCPPPPPPKSPRLATLPIRQKNVKVPSRKRSASMSAVPSPNNQRSQGHSRRAASEHVQSSSTPSRRVRKGSTPSATVAAVGTSSAPLSKSPLTIRTGTSTKWPSRSASTSATQTGSKPQRNSRRVASEHVGAGAQQSASARPSVATPRREVTETVTRTRNPNYVPKRRVASESVQGSGRIRAA